MYDPGIKPTFPDLTTLCANPSTTTCTWKETDFCSILNQTNESIVLK
jgi:hypothetical protein